MRSFLAGVLGGALVVGAVIAVLAFTDALQGPTRTVTVVRAPSLPASRRSRYQSARELYAQDGPGVVLVNAVGVNATQSPAEYLKGEGGQRGTATGSGFEIDGNGTILTNWHVVENATKITVGVDHRKAVEAQLVGKDSSSDLAVLRINANGLTLHPLLLGNSRNVQVGDPVLAIGNPFGLGQTLTTGVISGLQRQITAPNGVTIDNVIQTDAPINPGNSGGPLLNEQGQVIGINSQIETAGSGGGSVGIAFAIPINAARAELAIRKSPVAAIRDGELQLVHHSGARSSIPRLHG